MSDGTGYKASMIMVGGDVVSNRWLNVADGVIHSISEAPDPSFETLDLGEDTVIYPGCVNTHSHAFQALLRGSANDCSLTQFFEVVYKAAADMGPQDIYRGSRLAFEEMILNGITTVCDFFYINGDGNENARQVIQAARDAGIRLNLNRVIMDNDKLPDCVREDVDTGMARYRELAEEFASDPLVKITLAPHSVYFSTEQVIAAIRDQSQRENKKWFMHYSDSRWTRDWAEKRYGVSETAHLFEHKLMDNNFVGVHGIWANDDDIERLAQVGACISHNPVSNQFIGEPTARIWEMLQRGITVGLGTDGAASSPSLSIFQEMKQALLVQKSKHRDPGRMTAADGLRMATTAGSCIAQYHTGLLAPGYLADFIVCDLRHPTLQPVGNAASHFVYSLSPQAIRKVAVGGRVVLER